MYLVSKLQQENYHKIVEHLMFLLKWSKIKQFFTNVYSFLNFLVVKIGFK